MEHAGMSDVVVWLRRVAEGTAGVLYAESGDDGVKVREMWHPTDLFPVADEIERLRKATKKQANMIVDQEAEIEQLRDEAALRIDYKQMARGLEDRLREQANEIERLRGLLREALEEITRLRAALVSIARAPGADNETAYEMRKIAQEALGNE
jgi:predicted RNase H-like nuclease (RuvC/YqgF family)